jgi:dienelactone hydrolase
MLKSWGYVALAPDSLGNANLCASGSGIVAEAIDAYAALRFLVAREYVDADRIALVGYSMGGGAVLTAIEQGQFARDQPQHFRAAIAYYPMCLVSNGVMTAPLLVLIGERDDWTPAEACRKMAAHESDISIGRPPSGGAPVKLVVYPNATHAFDLVGPPQRYLGHFMEHDADAAEDAEAQMRRFLRATVGEPTGARR